MAKYMPANWEPPYPSWSVKFEDDVKEVIMAYFGAQLPSGDDSGEFSDVFLSSTGEPNGPASVERARYTDIGGFTNDIFIAYWTDPVAFDRWWQTNRFGRWWHEPARLKGDIGLWREILRLPISHFETLFSSENKEGVGIADSGIDFVGPIQEHGYWGGARDRIPLSASDGLESTAGDTLLPVSGLESRGRRLVIEPPKYLNVIRSGQNWTHCKPAELETYMTSVHPVLQKGMDFLAQNPVETGCATCRFMNEVSLEGTPLQRSFGLAYFLSLQHLEAWAKSHPTHLAIFREFHHMAAKHNFDLGLRLWHEVSVLPAKGCTFEYVNCDPGTGLLPYFASERM